MSRTAHIVIDLGFGDSGKGTIVDYLARSAHLPLIVRFNGGAQAAHNVVTPDGRHHTFAQFGSGMFVPGTSTYLSRFVVIDPPALIAEARHLVALGITDALRRIVIDQDALVATQYHAAANRIREALRGSTPHGSCGRGVGETMADMIAFPHQAVRARDLRDPPTLHRKLSFFRNLKRDEFAPEIGRLSEDTGLQDDLWLLLNEQSPDICTARLVESVRQITISDQSYLALQARTRDLIFEGAQGVLLDEWHGFHPYTTWSTTTSHNAKTLLSEIGFASTTETIGVLRTYTTRHGRGPFPTEDHVLTTLMPDRHNGTGRWQGDFRVGHLDLVLARYALSVAGGVDSIALTHMDKIGPESALRVCADYELSLDSLTARERTMILSSASEHGPRITIQSLRPKHLLTDLTYQEALTSILSKSRPQLRAIGPSSELAEMVGRELGKSVTITSYGPSALEKRHKIALRTAA